MQTAESKVSQELLRLEAHDTLLSQMYDLSIRKQEPFVRLIFLLASILKLQHMASAARLLAQSAFVEEIQALGRTMAEVVVNAAYLQHAEDEEIDRYQHFDTQSAYKHSVKLRPRTTVQLNGDDLRKMDIAVNRARSLTGRKDGDPSWSKRTLMQRAEYSDGLTHLNLMTLLVLTVYAHGHSAIHGTCDALDFFISNTGARPKISSDERSEKLFIALSSVNYAMCIMCFYLNSMFHLKLDEAIIKAGKVTV